MPTQTSGAKSFIILLVSMEAVNIRSTVFTFFMTFLKLSFRWKPEMVIKAISYPAFGTSLSSMPPLLPTYSICVPGSCSFR